MNRANLYDNDLHTLYLEKVSFYQIGNIDTKDHDTNGANHGLEFIESYKNDEIFPVLRRMIRFCARIVLFV